MLLEQRDFLTAYQQIKDEALGVGCSVLLLCGLNADALCAVRILTYLLRSDHIAFKVKPVNGYGELEALRESEIIGNEELKSIVLINCGGIRDIERLLCPEPHMTTFIIDSHRPLHLSNVYADAKTVVLYLDEDVAFPSDGSNLSGALTSSSSSEDSEDASDDFQSDDEGEAELDLGSGGVGDAGESSEAQTEREEHLSVGTASASGSEADGEAEDAHANGGDDADDALTEAEEAERLRRQEEEGVGGPAEDSEDEEEIRISNKRNRRRQREEEKALRRTKLRRYYGGSHFGTPASTIAYEISRQLNKDTNDLLWLCILGVTEHYIGGKMASDAYGGMCQYLTQEVKSKNADADEGSGRSGFYTEDNTLVHVSDSGSIKVEDKELRLFLYRHWSLWESMYYSAYVSPRVSAWSSQGRATLEEFLAKMGMSLSQCRQKFQFMAPELRDRLRQSAARYGPEFGLPELFFPSFSRSTGYRQPVAAADVVYAVDALLEGGGGDGGEWKEAFHEAMDCLNARSSQPKLWQRGVKLSMDMQRQVVENAVQIMEGGGITRLRHFRYAYLRAPKEGDAQRLLVKPMALARVGRFLVAIHRESGQWAGARARPFLLLAERGDSYLVVAVTCPQAEGGVETNRFSVQFRLAAEQSGARMKHDGFDTSVMEIVKEDAVRFVEALHFSMGV